MSLDLVHGRRSLGEFTVNRSGVIAKNWRLSLSTQKRFFMASHSPEMNVTVKIVVVRREEGAAVVLSCNENG